MKTAGMWIIAAAAVGLGFTAAESAVLRYHAMKQVGNMLAMICDEIRCSFAPFAQVFRSVSERVDPLWAYFLNGMAEELDAFSGKRFCQIWENGVDGLSKNCGLEESDREELKRLGKGMGYLDAQVQMDTIRHFLIGWEQRAEEIREELKDNQRVYRCLGIAAGFTVLILLS